MVFTLLHENSACECDAAMQFLLQWDLSVKDILDMGHLSKEDTIRSPTHIDLCTKIYLCIRDTSLYRTASSVPMVSSIERYHCTANTSASAPCIDHHDASHARVSGLSHHHKWKHGGLLLQQAHVVTEGAPRAVGASHSRSSCLAATQGHHDVSGEVHARLFGVGALVLPKPWGRACM